MNISNSNLEQIRFVEIMAEKFLALFHVYSPPVPIKLIAKQLGNYSNNHYRLPRGALGAYIKDKGLIVNNEQKIPETQHFTIAHEIGHWLLHNDGAQSLGINADCSEVSTEKNKERDANRFASAVLIPKVLLYQEAQRYNIINWTALERMAHTFGVSNLAMLFRIKNFVNYSIWEGPPIDWESLNNKELEWKQANKNISFAHITYILKKLSSKSGLSTAAYQVVHTRTNSKIQKIPRRPQFAKRTKFIEIVGLPNSGKDTLIKILSKYFRNLGFKVAIINEGFYTSSLTHPMADQPPHLRLQYSISLLTNKILEYGLSNEHDIVLINRGPFDCLAQTHFMHTNKELPKDEAKGMKNFILSILGEWIDQVVFLQVSPNESLRRERVETRGVIEHLGKTFDGIEEFPKQRTVNIKTLENLERCYNFSLSEHGDLFRPIFKVDSKNVKQTAEAVTRLIRPHPTKYKLPTKKKSNGYNQLSLPGFFPLAKSRARKKPHKLKLQPAIL